MMSIRLLTATIVVALLVGTTSALVITANPSSVTVLAGSSNQTTVDFYEDTINGTYYFKALINNPNVTVTVFGPYLDPAFTTPVVVGGVNYTTAVPAGTQINWPGVKGTDYYFKVVFTAPKTITTTQTFLCTLSGVVVNFTTYQVNVTGTTVPGQVPPIPELLTGVLFGLGLVSLIVVRRRI